MDRTHRLGQHRPIQVTRLVCRGTIEERVLALQRKKQAAFDLTVGQDDGALGKLTEDDMKFLFSR
jgi:DNA repair protein RAD16